jgi:hypothetical protein
LAGISPSSPRALGSSPRSVTSPCSKHQKPSPGMSPPPNAS